MYGARGGGGGDFGGSGSGWGGGEGRGVRGGNVAPRRRNWRL